MTSKIQIPFTPSPTGNSWPSIVAAPISNDCRRPKDHRLYHVIGARCPCGPIPMKVMESNVPFELHVFADNIQVVKGREVVIDFSEMLQRIKDLEAKVEELSKKE